MPEAVLDNVTGKLFEGWDVALDSSVNRATRSHQTHLTINWQQIVEAIEKSTQIRQKSLVVLKIYMESFVFLTQTLFHPVQSVLRRHTKQGRDQQAIKRGHETGIISERRGETSRKPA